eukprot:scaffold1658_cov393-Prasinococcus_capsulatus_cf.AAC.18
MGHPCSHAGRYVRALHARTRLFVAEGTQRAPRGPRRSMSPFVSGRGGPPPPPRLPGAAHLHRLLQQQPHRARAARRPGPKALSAAAAAAAAAAGGWRMAERGGRARGERWIDWLMVDGGAVGGAFARADFWGLPPFREGGSFDRSPRRPSPANSGPPPARRGGRGVKGPHESSDDMVAGEIYVATTAERVRASLRAAYLPPGAGPTVSARPRSPLSAGVAGARSAGRR